MNIEKVYIEGFIKRAAEYGLSSDEAISLLKQAKKEDKKEDKKEKSILKKLIRAGLIGGGTLAGGVIGLRTLPRLIRRGRLAEPEESLLGKVVYNNEGITTPGEIIHLPGGRSLRGILRKHRNQEGLKGTLSRAGLKLDEWLGVPQRHYGVGVGSGRIADVTKTYGRKIKDKSEFGEKIYIDDEGKLLSNPRIHQRQEGLEGAINASEIEAFEKRYEDMQKNRKFDKRELSTLKPNNCESYARGIGVGNPKSHQIKAMYSGALLGSLLGGGGTAYITRDKEKK